MSSGGQPARVAIASAYPSVRAGLRAMLAPLDTVEVVAYLIGSDLEPFEAPDLLVIDVDSDDTEYPSRLAASHPEAALVLLVDDVTTGRRMAQLAGRGLAILSRDAGPDELAAAVLATLRGLVVLDPAVAPMAVTAPAPLDLDETLTDREQQVLALVALGLPNKTIAVELGISEHTVKFHVAAILDKLDAASRTEAVAIAARRGLLVL
ncbi:MAG: response regulator transcription factor [Thermomicrobiales bacterium]